MGDLIPFRKPRPKRWTRPEDYGQVLPPGRWRGEPPPPSGPRKWWDAVRPWLLLTALASLWFGYDAETLEPWSALASDPVRVEGTFTICGEARSALCMVDGDTFRLGARSVRLLGIDAPETRAPLCPAEAAKGVEATAALQRLLNQGPFTIVGRVDGLTDKYGRDLRAAYRTRRDGTRQSIAEDLLATGTVRRYFGGSRGGWC
ncbi:MAG: thermonuclease family protein [Novosphingobium sp.]